MKRSRKIPEVPLTQLRFTHLLTAAAHTDHRVAHLKVPADLMLRVHEVADHFGVSATATLIALLNEGLSRARQEGLGERRARG